MIEVIKEGQPKFDISCGYCDSVLRFQLEDVRKWYDQDTGWVRYQITCPVCGKAVEIDTVPRDYLCSHSSEIETLNMSYGKD